MENAKTNLQNVERGLSIFDVALFDLVCDNVTMNEDMYKRCRPTLREVIKPIGPLLYIIQPV